MWEAVASILMKNRERIGSWRDYSVSDYHYYSSAVTFIGLDVIKVTLIFSFSSSSSFFFFPWVCVCVQFFLNQMCDAEPSWQLHFCDCKSRRWQNPNRPESKPKCHLSFLLPLREFSPIKPSRSYLGHCANKEHPVFKLGEALSRILPGCLQGHTASLQWETRVRIYHSFSHELLLPKIRKGTVELHVSSLLKLSELNGTMSSVSYKIALCASDSLYQRYFREHCLDEVHWL